MSEKKQKSAPKCYSCVYRRKSEWSAHSKCVFPGNKTDLVSIFSVDNKNFENAEKLGIVVNRTGIVNGWFNWPIDFDPVWLINCNGYKQKEK